MASLLGLSRSAAEESLNAMVVGKTVQAKIDRLDGIVDFQTATEPNQVGWIWRPLCFKGLAITKVIPLTLGDPFVYKKSLNT